MIIKGTKRSFSISVVVAIISGRHLFENNRVKHGEVAEVNEFLFPKSGGCMGSLVTLISQRKSKPEILKQYPELKKVDFDKIDVDLFFFLRKFSDRLELTSTGK